MKYIKSSDFIKLIDFNYINSESLSLANILEYGNVDSYSTYIKQGFNHKKLIRKTHKHLVNLNWNIYCAITSPVYVMYKSRAVGMTTMSSMNYNAPVVAKQFIFIRDKTPDELIDSCKRIVKLKAFT